MKRLLPLILLLVPILAQNNDTFVEKKAKSFSIFSVVQFQNNLCTTKTTAGANVMRGTCYTASECTSSGGTSSGSCASGFGVCCMFTVSTCSSTISKNITYIQNPNFPSGITTTGTCSYTITTASDICQIRLDFDNFVTLNPVAATGACTAVDRLTVSSPSGSGFNANPPVLCGTLTGSHMYIETGRQNPSQTTIAIANALATAPIRTYKIKVTMIECNNPLRAPTDCLQYFTGTSGSFTSFNYQGGSTTAPGQFLANQLYTICVRQEEGFCTALISQSDSNTATVKAFSITGAATTAGRTAAACAAAQITIPTPQALNLHNTDSYCGGVLGAADAQTPNPSVITTSVPIQIGVIADNTAQTGIGFNLMYSQQAC